MLSFVFRKIWNKKWMILCLLLGNLLMIAISAAAPMYSHAALQRALTRNLSDYLVETGKNPGTVRVLTSYSLAARNKVEAFQNVERSHQAFAQMLDEMDIPRLWETSSYSKTPIRVKPDLIVDGGSSSILLRFAAYSNFEDHVTITHGRMSSPTIVDNTIEVVVNQRTFMEQMFMLDQEFTLENVSDPEGNPYRLKVVGIFESNPQDLYWTTNTSFWYNTCVIDLGLFQDLFINREKHNEDFSAEWNCVLDYSKIRSDQTVRYLDILKRYQKTLEDMDAESVVHFQSTLESFLPEQQKLTTTIWVLLLPIFVLLVAFIFMVSRQMLEMEQNEISIYKSRGANKGQIILLYLLQSLCIALVSLAGGIPLGMFLCKVLGASNAFLEFVQRAALPLEITRDVWLFAGVAAGFSVCTMVLPVFRFANVNIVDHKRQKNRVGERPWWQMFFLDVILLGVSIYGLYQYNGQKEYLSQKVLEGGSLDPLLYLCSSLFMIGCALVILRIFPWLIRLIFQLGKRWWSPSLYTSFLRIIRTRSNQGFLMVFLILTVSMGIYNAQTARSINANAEDKIMHMAGADIVLQEAWKDNKEQLADLQISSAVLTPSETKVTYTEPPYEKYPDMEGVASATKVLVDNKITVSLEEGHIDNAMLMGIHTKEFGETVLFKESLLPYHYYEYLNAISQNSYAILVSSNFRDMYGYQLGDALRFSSESGSFRGVIYGFVDYWPTYAPVVLKKGDDGVYTEQNNFLIVAHLAQLQASWGITPYQVWIDAEDSTQFIYDYAEETGTGYPVFRDAAAQLLKLKNDPIFQGTNGILTIGFICILLLCTIGFLIYWILSIQSRTLQFGIFRAMGMTMREIFTMLLNEQFFITGISIGAGIFVGIFTSKLFVPLVQIAYSSADQVIPIEIVSQSSDYVRLFAVIGAVILVCLVVLGVLISKINISKALKLGED